MTQVPDSSGTLDCEDVSWYESVREEWYESVREEWYVNVPQSNVGTLVREEWYVRLWRVPHEHHQWFKYHGTLNTSPVCEGSSGCAICQKYMFSGESNTLPYFRRLQQIWKTESNTVARPTRIADGCRVAAYVCVNLACTSSIILQSRNTADAHPRIIRSPMWRMR